jgi:cytochrome c biogenesis protein CcdA
MDLRPCPRRTTNTGGVLQGRCSAPVATGLGLMLPLAGTGVQLGVLGSALGIDANTIRVAGAATLIASALMLLVPALGDRLSHRMLPIASAAKAASTWLDGGSLLNAAALGAVQGLVLRPCPVGYWDRR